MPTPQAIRIILPQDMANRVQEEVRIGAYASEDGVLCDGLPPLLERDQAVQNWLEQQVGPAYDALKADPSRALSTEQVRAHLAAEHARAQ